MTVTAYKNNSPINALRKNLSNALNISNVELKTPTQVMNPTIVLGNFDFTEYNYMYIPTLKRYYFVKPESATVYNRLVTIQLECDTLYTFADDIRKSVGYLDRQERAGTLLFDGADMPNYAEVQLQYKKFPKSFNGQACLLLCNSI